jgi:hypothetical protein
LGGGEAVAEFNRMPRSVARIYNPSSSNISERVTRSIPRILDAFFYFARFLSTFRIYLSPNALLMTLAFTNVSANSDAKHDRFKLLCRFSWPGLLKAAD